MNLEQLQYARRFDNVSGSAIRSGGWLSLTPVADRPDMAC